MCPDGDSSLRPVGPGDEPDTEAPDSPYTVNRYEAFYGTLVLTPTDPSEGWRVTYAPSWKQRPDVVGVASGRTLSRSQSSQRLAPPASNTVGEQLEPTTLRCRSEHAERSTPVDSFCR